MFTPAAVRSSTAASSKPREFRHHQGAGVFCLTELQALGEYSPLLIGLRSRDMFLEDLRNLITFPFSVSGKILDLPFCRLTVAHGGDAGVYYCIIAAHC